MPFTFTRLAIPDVVLVEARSFPDGRGFFLEGYKESEFTKNGIAARFVQDNHSRSARGTLRGLHYQKDPAAQAKLVMAVRGEIFDVAVDIRRGSATYGRWVGETLSEKNHRLLYVPAGFAHGFCVLSDAADITYKVSSEYSPEHDRGILWNDPKIGIRWPLDGDPLLSDKDLRQPLLADADNDFAAADGGGGGGRPTN